MLSMGLNGLCNPDDQFLFGGNTAGAAGLYRVSRFPGRIDGAVHVGVQRAGPWGRFAMHLNMFD